jgi:hypothetical protein
MQLTLPEITTVSATIAKSGLFGVRTPEQACALMLLSQAEGFHPVLAARDYHVIQGRPTLKSDAMLARYQQAGGKVEWPKYENSVVRGKFTHPSSGVVEVEWTLEMARQAGLTTKDVWRQYPRAMLKSRVISEGVRVSYPGVCVGIYTPEEVEQFDARPPEKPAKVVEVHCSQMGDGGVVVLKEEPAEEVELIPIPGKTAQGGAHPLDALFSCKSKAAIAKANEWLIANGRITDGKTYRDLPEETVEGILNNAERFFATVGI